MNGRSSGADSVRPAFLARDVVIDCPQSGCPGKILTVRREFAESGGTASRVVLRCTRAPEEHELAITIEPFSAEEKEELRAQQQRGEEMLCRRCGTTMEHRTVLVPDAWTDSVSQEEAYACPWCGVKWLVPAELKCHQAG
jgi:DNA-directed RNA polymerase subunit RPC12/RpoP